MTQRPRFSTDQIARLRRLNLREEQIAALCEMLISIRTILTIVGTQARVGDVRDELTRLHDAFVGSRKSVERMRGPIGLSALLEARARLEVAEYERAEPPGSLDRAYDAISEALALVDAAISELPKKPTRHRTADPRPVQMIANALAQGWAASHLGKEMPPLPCEHLPRADDRSAFSQAVGICYEAAGNNNANPERAIKGYIAQRNKRRETRRTTKIVTLKRRTRKLPRGRNAGRKSDVPS
jgi:hypothetical protein